jgi:predicted HNH restriction endonuclease
MKRDRHFLRVLSIAAWQELRRRHLGKPFRLASRVRLRTTYSAGWAATLGNFGGYRTYAEVWIDRFTGHATRKIYYALVASNGAGLARLVKGARRELGEHMSVTLSQWDQECEYSRLAKRLAKARFGRPIYERYPENEEFFYGIYEFDRTGLQKNEFNRLVERTVDFFQTITDTVSPGSTQSDRDTYSAIENRLLVIRHLQRERRSHAATLRKQRDNYICQICHFDFLKAYGSLGEDFAEAHHIVPLNSNTALRNTTVEDLLTVCSNCHRMLHRMSGTERDITRLRQIVRRRR